MVVLFTILFYEVLYGNAIALNTDKQLGTGKMNQSLMYFPTTVMFQRMIFDMQVCGSEPVSVTIFTVAGQH